MSTVNLQAPFPLVEFLQVAEIPSVRCHYKVRVVIKSLGIRSSVYFSLFSSSTLIFFNSNIAIYRSNSFKGEIRWVCAEPLGTVVCSECAGVGAGGGEKSALQRALCARFESLWMI